MQNAITKYVQKPIVQQTTTTSFQNIEKPVIYICQDGQFSYKKAEEFGYKSQTDVIFGLLGYPDMTNITWKGRHGNVSFADLAKKVYSTNYTKFKYINDVKNDITQNLREEFFAPPGFCFKVQPRKDQIKFRVTEKSTAFITDPAKTNFLKLYRMKYGSIRFGPIGNSLYESKVFEIQISLHNNFVDEGMKCTEYGSHTYGECIESKMENSLLDCYGCLPPWFGNSTHLTCEINKNVKTPDKESLKGYRHEFHLFDKGIDMDLFKQCLPPCLTMHVNYKLISYSTSAKNHATIRFIFANEVNIYTNVNGYDMFSLVVDMGSSLGLWLGLSALGLFDIIVETVANFNYQRVRNWIH